MFRIYLHSMRGSEAGFLWKGIRPGLAWVN